MSEPSVVGDHGDLRVKLPPLMTKTGTNILVLDFRHAIK